ncbi:hypothetical protein KAR91_03280, partial [Candidatus Pacearchaeota archaeon]|nr:hypothetical protein [Candidatus Pacearchaeota archaeon]
CVRSFTGYPLQGDGDLSALKYVVCVALKLRSKTRPWARLPYSNRRTAPEIADKYVAKLKKFMDKAILTNQEVKDKIEEKLKYLLEEPPAQNIPPHFDVKLWLTFLPPLQSVNVTGLRNIGSTFSSTLKNSVSEGKDIQFAQLASLFSKMFYFSLHIIELIQRVVNKKAPILTNSAEEPLLENACCNEGTKNTLRYFTEKESDIVTFDNTVLAQQELYDSVVNLVKAAYIFDPQDTKLKYPKVSTAFSETTIYQAFIRFCNYNSDTPIPDNLLGICGVNKSGFDKNSSLEDKIRIMKSERIVYNLDSFYRLLNTINRENIVNIILNPTIMTARRALEGTLSYLEKKESPNVCGSKILEVLRSLLDTFDINVRSNDRQVAEVMVALDNENNALRVRLIALLRESGATRKTDELLRQIDDWDLRGEGIYISREDETAVTVYRALRTFSDNIVRVYPSIIANEVNYKNTKVPANWKVSQRHKGDIQGIIASEMQPLRQFYGDEDLKPILQHVARTSGDLLNLIDNTPFFADILFHKRDHKTILNGAVLRKLSKYYLFCALNMYLEALDANLDELEETAQTPDLSSFEDAPESERRDSIEAQVIRGREQSIRAKVVQVLNTYLMIVAKQKKTFNISNEEIKTHILKGREKEKARVTGRLGDLTVEEREIENVLKNHRLGEWGLGQTRALFEYDPEQYEKERAAIEEDTLTELRLNKVDGVTERNRDIYKLDYLEEQVIQEREDAEIAAAFRAQPDDDDFGDRDSDAQFD